MGCDLLSTHKQHTSLRFAPASALLLCLQSLSSVCPESRARVILRMISWGRFHMPLAPLWQKSTIDVKSSKFSGCRFLCVQKMLTKRDPLRQDLQGVLKKGPTWSIKCQSKSDWCELMTHPDNPQPVICKLDCFSDMMERCHITTRPRFAKGSSTFFQHLTSHT